MEGDLHAAALLGVILAGIVVVVRFGDLPDSRANLAKAALRGVVTLLGAGAVLLLTAPICFCGPGNNPRSQLWIPAVLASITAASVEAPRARRVALILIVAAGVILGNHFSMLVLDRGRCGYTGDVAYISNSCDRPAIASRTWHTWLTGIYRVTPV